MKKEKKSKKILLIIVVAITISMIFILSAKWPIYKYSDIYQDTRTITVDGIKYQEITEMEWKISGYDKMIGFVDGLRWRLYAKKGGESCNIIQARYFSFDVAPDPLMFRREDVDIPAPSVHSIDYCIMRNTDNEIAMVENQDLIKGIFNHIESNNEKTNSGQGHTIGTIECHTNINKDLVFILNFIKISDEYVIYVPSRSIFIHITDDFGKELEKYFN